MLWQSRTYRFLIGSLDYLSPKDPVVFDRVTSQLQLIWKSYNFLFDWLNKAINLYNGNLEARLESGGWCKKCIKRIYLGLGMGNICKAKRRNGPDCNRLRQHSKPEMRIAVSIGAAQEELRAGSW